MKNKIIVAALAVVLVVSMTVAGCAGPGPAEKDTLVVALSTLHEETFLPWNGGLARIFYMDCLYETLTFLDPVTLEAVPGLAESWNRSDDAKTWTFHIRRGVPFRDALGNIYGNVTAADVKYSIEGVISPGSIVGPASVLRDLIDNVTTPDDYTVVVNLKSPDPLLDVGYFSQANPVWIVCKSYCESKGNWTANAQPVGTGPYVLKSHSPGSSILLERVENHWRMGTPDWKYIKFVKVPEEATRVAMLQTGEADLAPINYDSVDGVRAAGLQILTVPNSWSPYIVFGGTVPARPARWNPANPWSNVTVREALNLAIDKQAIVDTIFHGQAEVAGAQSYVPAWMNITPWGSYNVTRARELLAEAGYPNGFNVTIKAYTTSPGAELPLVAQAVASYWEAINVTCTVYTVDYASVVRPEWTGDNATWYIFPHRGMSMTDSIQPIKSAFDKNSKFVVYADNETEALKDLIYASSDPAYREQKAYEMGLLLRDKVAFIPIAVCDEPYGASDYVGDWPALSVTVTNIYKITRAT